MVLFKPNEMKKFAILLAIAICSSSLLSQSELVKLQDKLIGLSPDTTYRKLDRDQVHSINEFWKIFKEIRNKEIGLDRLKGRAAFGFIGNSAEDANIFRINGGISLKKGSYPQDFEFSTLLNITVDNGVMEENLSNLRISYDRFIKCKNPFLAEGYSFINRRSDAYLGVNQRYEIGAGIILAHWGKKLFPASQASYDKYCEEQISFKSKDNKVIVCDVKNCVPIEARGITEADFGALNNAQKRITNSIIKNNSPLRLGLMLGFFFEVENVSHADSLMTQNGRQFFQHDFLTTSKFRWELRPTIDFRVSDAARFRIRPYLKGPMPWEYETEVDGKMELDYRVDFPIQFDISLNDQFSLSVHYIYFYDNAPSSIAVGAMDANKNPLYLTAKTAHHFYNFSASYSFK